MDLTPVQEGERVVGFKQMEQAAAIEKVFAEFFHRAKGAMRDCPGGYRVDAEHTWGAHERTLSAAIDEARKNVHAAMLDNINTPGVVKALKELSKSDVAEVKAFKSPPNGVKLTMETVCILKEIKPRESKVGGKSVLDYWVRSLGSNPTQLNSTQHAIPRRRLLPRSRGRRMIETRVRRTPPRRWSRPPRVSPSARRM